MVEYSLDIKIPEWVWDHPILVEMSHAVIDVMTWPNVSVLLFVTLHERFTVRCRTLSLLMFVNVVYLMLRSTLTPCLTEGAI